MSSPGPSSTRSLTNGVGPGVLLVEDDPGYAQLVRSMIDETPLGELGFEHTGLVSDACDYLLQVGVGCVLLDLSLPDARRLQGVERLRAADPDTPIVVLTNLEDDGVSLAVSTRAPGPVLSVLAEQNALRGLEVRGATLEDVFLQLTGREYRA